MTGTAGQGQAGSAAATRGAAYWALALLTAIYLLNYLDRFLVAPLTSDIKGALDLSDAQLGWLQSVFIFIYMVAAPVFGAWGDRGSRTRPIALGVGIWSVATVLTGLAQNYGQLLAARAVVGIGEAAVITIGPALLADCFPAAGRGRVFAVLNMAIPVGAALGYVVGGQMGAHFGWRSAFFVAGAPGLVLAIMALWLPDPPRGSQDPTARQTRDAKRGGSLALYRDLLRRARLRLVILGYAAYTFGLGGLAYWMPAFLERVRGVPKANAATEFGIIVVATGILGTIVGGWLADYFLKYSQQSYLWFSAVVTLLAAPVALVALFATDRALYHPALVIAELLLFMSTGPINAAIVNLVSPLERASATALTMVLIHLLGDVPSPPLIGYLSDAGSLARAVLIVPLAFLAGGIVWLIAARLSSRSTPAAA